MKEPLISVVVAVYNTEAYLERCIQSVLSQTYENWELILVDDGSKDACPSICDQYEQADSRIRVIHQANAGLSAARNAGTQIIEGQFLLYLDSDDCLSPEALLRMMLVQEQTGADVVEGGNCKFSEDIEIPGILACVNASDAPAASVYTSEDYLRILIADHAALHQTAWGKLIRSELQTIPFLDGKYHEDEYWTYQIIAKANKIAFLEEPLYLYYVRQGSIMQTRYSAKRLDGLWAYKARYQALSVSHPNLTLLLAKEFFGACMFHYQMLLAHKDVDVDGCYRKEIKREMRVLPYRTWKRTLPLKQRIWQSAFRAFPGLVGRLRNLFKIGW